MPDPLRGKIFLSVVDTYANVDLNRGSCNDTDGRQRVELADAIKGRCAVLLVFGQSNGANSGGTLYTPKHAVYNFNIFDGLCYVARDPLLAHRKAWQFPGRLRRPFDRARSLQLGDPDDHFGWRKPGRGVDHGRLANRRLQIAIKRAAGAGLRFTHLLWHQGETNARHGPEPDVYIASIHNIRAALNDYGVDAPLYVAQATYRELAAT